jgi:hypothetical protein
LPSPARQAVRQITPSDVLLISAYLLSAQRYLGAVDLTTPDGTGLGQLPQYRRLPRGRLPGRPDPHRQTPRSRPATSSAFWDMRKFGDAEACARLCGWPLFLQHGEGCCLTLGAACATSA